MQRFLIQNSINKELSFKTIQMKNIFIIILALAICDESYSQAELSLEYSLCENCDGTSSDPSETYLYEDSYTNFEYKSISSDFGPRVKPAYDFHGGVDFVVANRCGDAIVAPEPGTITKIKRQPSGIVDILIDGVAYDYGFRHLFYGESGAIPELPMKCGQFVLLYNPEMPVEGNLVILDLIHSNALCSNSGVTISYDGETYVTDNNVTSGVWLGPIGGSGGYSPHLHMEVLENPLVIGSDLLALNPLEELEYDLDYYSNYNVEFVGVEDLSVLRGNNLIPMKFLVELSDTDPGSTYTNGVLDINSLHLEIAPIEGAFSNAQGFEGDIILNYGGVALEPLIEPTSIISTIGSPVQTGVRPRAYKTGGEYHAHDEFFMKEFNPRIDALGDVAKLNTEALYPDGDYWLRPVMTTVKGFEKSNQLLTKIDNFFPHVKDVQITTLDGEYHSYYSREGDEMVKTEDSINITTYDTYDIELTFSEDVTSVQFKVGDGGFLSLVPMEDVDWDDYYSTIWGGSYIYYGEPDEDAIIEIRAVDRNGNELLKDPTVLDDHAISDDGMGIMGMEEAEDEPLEIDGGIIELDAELEYADAVPYGLEADTDDETIDMLFAGTRSGETGWDRNHKFNGGLVDDDDGDDDELSFIIDNYLVKDGIGGGSGDEDNIIDPGESIDLEVTIINTSGMPATDVNATFYIEVGPGISVSDYMESTSDILPGDAGTFNDFDFNVPDDYPLDYIECKMYVITTGDSHTLYFTLPVGSDEDESGANLVYADHDIHDGIGGGEGNEDGIINPGEEIDLEVRLLNDGLGDAPDVRAWLSTDNPYITITDDEEFWGDINAGESEWEADFDFDVSEDCPNGEITFELHIESDDNTWDDTFVLEITASPNLVYAAHLIKDGTGGGEGDSDEIAEQGEEIDLDVRLNNIGEGDANSVSAILSCSHDGIDITDETVSWGDIWAGYYDWAADFDFTISDDCEPGMIEFELEIESDEGIWTETFYIEVVGEEGEEIDVIYTDNEVKDGIDGHGEGNGNGIADLGEEIDIDVELENNSGFDVHDVSATLVCYLDEFDLTDDYEFWGDIPDGDTEWEADFDLTIPDDYPYGGVYLYLEVESDEGSCTSLFYLSIDAGFVTPITGVSLDDESIKKGYVGEPNYLPQENRAKIRIFPNPSSDHIIIAHSLNESATLQLFDANGRLVLAQNLTDAISNIDISFLEAGIYTAIIKSNDIVETKKIIKL
jgi:hypothetical protein